MAECIYRIGIDVGDRYVGLVAIEFDENGVPLRFLERLVVHHEGGLYPGTGTTPRSRKAEAGAARRTRRMRKRKRQRLKALDRYLAKHGYPDVQPQITPYDAWHARARLVSTKIDDEDQLKNDLALALRHIARHRGWRNPWKTLASTRKLPVPSETLLANQARAREHFGDEVNDLTTIGQIGALAASRDYLLRPRNITVTKGVNQKKNVNDLERSSEEALAAGHPTAPILGWQVRQEDQINEVERIWERQGLPSEELPQILTLLFAQTKPHVPSERVGRDALRPKLYRAPIAALEFQDFRILAAIANLRVRTEGSRRLTKDERFTAFQFMSGWREKEPLSWADVAEELGFSAHALAAPTTETNQRLAFAPTNRTLTTLGTFFKGKKIDAGAREWWQSASYAERSLLAQLIADATPDTQEQADASGLADVLLQWDEDTVADLMELDLQSGRAAYSTDTLLRLNARMENDGTDLFESIQAEFNIDPSRLPRPDWDDQTGQPTVDRVLTIVRRFVGGCERKYGKPESVTVEHVRTGLMGAEQRSSIIAENNRNRRDSDRIRTELQADGIREPSRLDVRRHRQVQRQNCTCLYCGTAITTTTCELDHIVPRRGGGSSQGSNLVAVCRECNASKAHRIFAEWAEDSQREGVSVKEATKRVRHWLNASASMKREVTRRLQQKRTDPPIDERDLASTSYAATEITRRILGHFHDEVPVVAFGGSGTREARRAGRVDHIIRLRGSLDKSRLDTRHHAIDAAVLTLQSPAIYRVLLTRVNLKREHEVTGEAPEWRDYEGADQAEKVLYRRWQKNIATLAELMRQEIENNRVPVTRPIRLRKSRGAVHKDEIQKPEKYPPMLWGEWNSTAIDRVIDPELHLALRKLLTSTKSNKITVDATTPGLPDRYRSNSLIPLFAQDAPAMMSPRGIILIGKARHHARILTWDDPKKGPQLGIQRVFAAELGEMLKDASSNDLFEAPIPFHTMSHRDLQPQVRAAVEQGLTRQIGWITLGDEIEIDPSDFAEDTTKFGKFLREFPERNWSIAGLKESRKLVLRPLMLSAEGASPANSSLTAEVLDGGVKVHPSTLLASPGTTIIRRTGLGRPRWDSGLAHLPESFNVHARMTLEWPKN